jgi:hypothetical protein
MFNADDVIAAHFAAATIALAKTEEDTVDGIIRADADSAATIAAERALFERGRKILDAGYHVAYSTPHVVMLDAHAQQLAQQNPASPIVQVTADYVGTTQRYCYAALVKNG